MSSLQFSFKTMNAYELHKAVINTYILNRPGDTSLLKRDTSKDKRDIDIIRANHKFLWNEEEPTTWEERLAKKYYNKLFKEYCICDVTLYKKNKIALRWRTEKELVAGKGQFSCGNRKCNSKENLRTWEVNFGYHENNEKKNVLVKLRLCPPCSDKLNYGSKKREIRRISKKKEKLSNTKVAKSKDKKHIDKPSTSKEIIEDTPVTSETISEAQEVSVWTASQVKEKSREEEFESYLEDLLF